MTSDSRSFFSKTALWSALAGVLLMTQPAHAETVYMVQLGSFENEDKAQERWNQLREKFPDLFNPLSFKRKEVKLPSDDFVYHRAQAGPIKNKAEAEAICDDLLISGFECYIAETALFEPTVQPVKTAKAAPVVKPVAVDDAFKQDAAAVSGEKAAADFSPKFPPLPVLSNETTADSVNVVRQDAVDNAAKEAKALVAEAPSMPEIPKAVEASEVEDALDKELAALAPSTTVFEAPKLEAPKIEASVAEEPKLEAPKFEVSVAETPKFEAANSEVAKVAEPAPVVELPAPARSATPLNVTPSPLLKPAISAPAVVASAAPSSDSLPSVPRFGQDDAYVAPVENSSPESLLPAFLRNRQAAPQVPVVSQQAESLDSPAPSAQGEVRLDVPPPSVFQPNLTAVEPSAPVVVDNITEDPAITGGYNNHVQVAEAVRVPLVDVPQPQRAANAPSISHFKGYPSSSLETSSLWAEMSYFTTQNAALGYWSVLQQRDEQLPQGVRLRVTRPYLSQGSRDRVSLRVGPFKDVTIIKRLCSHTRPEQLMCRAVKDLGASIANRAGGERQRYSAAERHIAKQAGTSRAGYWLQLGSFPSIREAQKSWVGMKETYPKQLSALQEDILTPGRSSMRSSNYRLRAGPFADSTSAVSACERLKRQGGLCIVVADR